MQTKVRKLIIVGNGFDLGHHMHTHFDDFMSDSGVQKEHYRCFEDKDNSWNRIESKYKQLISDIVSENEAYVDLMKEVDQIIVDYGFDVRGDVAYYDYKSKAFVSEIKEIAAQVYLLESFEGEFLMYLIKEYADNLLSTKVEPYKNLQTLFDETTKVINFNYTNVIEQIYDFSNVKHIHGNINDNIIIGCDSISRIEKSLINGKYSDVDTSEKSDLSKRKARKHFFEKVLCETNKNQKELIFLLKSRSKDYLEERQNILDELEIEKYDEIHIIGHSLGEADWKVFDVLDKCIPSICYYYDEVDRLEKEKIINRKKWGFSLSPDTNLFK